MKVALIIIDVVLLVFGALNAVYDITHYGFQMGMGWIVVCMLAFRDLVYHAVKEDY